MTRDEIISLAEILAESLHDLDTLDIYMNDVFHERGADPTPHFVEATIKALTSGIAEYTFEADMLRIIYAIIHDEILSPCTEQAFEAYSSTWQSTTGTPTMFTQDSITARTYLLYPIPDFTSDPSIPVHGAPWGEDLPANSLTLIYSDDREDNILSIYALPLAFDALSHEFSYPSDHQDESFAALCRNAAQLFYRLLGVI